jgi:hypothetical protein
MHTFDVPCSDGVCKLDFDGLIARYPLNTCNKVHHDCNFKSLMKMSSGQRRLPEMC